MQSDWKSLGPLILASFPKQTDSDMRKLPLRQAGVYFSLPSSGLSFRILVGILVCLLGGEGKFTAFHLYCPGGCAPHGISLPVGYNE